MLSILFCLLIFQDLPPVQIVQAQPIPDPVLAEGTPPAISGDSLWLSLVPREGMDAQWLNVRLAGIEAPAPAGQATSQLAQDSMLALNSIIEWQFVEVSCSRAERVTDWHDDTRRWLERTRYVCALRLMHPTENDGFVPAKRDDVALEMLRRGRAWLRGFNLSDVWQDEVRDSDELAYYTAQSEARQNQRGLWLWANATWPFGARPERLPTLRSPMPARKP